MLGSGGIILVDKPAGVTSFKIVDHVRRQLIRSYPQLQQRRQAGKGPRPPRFKCGHAGTLDPLATGVLAILVGKGSRLSPFLMGQEKTYLATISFGRQTDTLDRDGVVTIEAPVPASADGLPGLLPSFLGEIMQVPPLVSALKVDGKALHKRVRAGEDVAEPEPRPVTIHHLQWQDIRWGHEREGQPVYEADLLVDCSSGTYVRSLARDLARALGSEGHIQELRRLRVGPFDVSDAHTGVLEMEGTDLADIMLPLDQALPQVPSLELDPVEAGLVRQGGQPQPAWLDRLPEPPVPVGKSGLLIKLVDPSGQLVAVARIDAESGLPATALVIPENQNLQGD